RFYVPARNDFGHEACGAAGDLADEFDAGRDGMRVFTDVGRPWVEIAEFDDRRFARIVRLQLHLAGPVFRMPLENYPAEEILLFPQFGISGLVAGKMGGNSKYEQVRVRLAEIRSLEHRRDDAIGRIETVASAPVREIPVGRLERGVLEDGKFLMSGQLVHDADLEAVLQILADAAQLNIGRGLVPGQLLWIADPRQHQ